MSVGEFGPTIQLDIGTQKELGGKRVVPFLGAEKPEKKGSPSWPPTRTGRKKQTHRTDDEVPLGQRIEPLERDPNLSLQFLFVTTVLGGGKRREVAGRNSY